MAKPSSHKIRVFKGANGPELDKETLALLVKYLKYAVSELGLENAEVKIRLLGAKPKEPITTGAYNPTEKTCSTIVRGRHFVDC